MPWMPEEDASKLQCPFGIEGKCVTKNCMVWETAIKDHPAPEYDETGRYALIGPDDEKPSAPFENTNWMTTVQDWKNVTTKGLFFGENTKQVKVWVEHEVWKDPRPYGRCKLMVKDR